MSVDKQPSQSNYTELRARAADLLRGEEIELSDYSQEDIERLLYEIRVYHIELELQNDELRETRNKLAEIRDKYSNLYHFAPVPYLTFDNDGVIRELNLAAAALLGRERGNLVNRPFITHLHTGSYQDFRLLLNSVYDQEATDKRSKRVELTIKKRDGTNISAEAEVNMANVNDGDTAYCRMVLFDISERKQAEQAIIRAQKLESLSVLAGGVAHDFNNLLVAIQNQIALAKHTFTEQTGVHEEASDHLQKAIRASERAADLTRQLQAYAGHAANKVEFINLKELLAENRELFASAATSRVNIKIESAPDLPSIKADPGQIQQIIMNLIINATEATENRPGLIQVETTPYTLTADEARYWQIGEKSPAPGTYVRLTVQDNGKGMDIDTLTRIFDPFYTTKFEGRGLGLAAVMGVMNNLKGGIHVESQIGIGSTFQLIIPAVSGNTQPTAVSTTDDATQQYESSNQAILIIDDEPAVLEAISDILDVFDQKALPALSGEEGLALLEKESAQIQLVILDLTMPGLDGLQTLHRLRENHPHLPVILSSGFTREDLLPRLENLHNVSFLQKPYSVHALIQAIQTSLEETNNTNQA